MIKGKTFAEVYKQLALEILQNGEEVSPRGKKTKELLQETFCIEVPTFNLAYIQDRNFSLMHAIAESLMIAVRNDSVYSYTLMNPRMKLYSDNGQTLHGAYGYRIADDLQNIVEKLLLDKDSRQAVVNIYDLHKDLATKTLDVPCTICLQFMIRNDKLNMHVYMRSNDIIWGTPYDVFVFTNLQQIIANSIGIPVGKYYHTATSLHCYEDMLNTLEMIARSNIEPIEVVNKNDLDSWHKMAFVFTQIASPYTFRTFEEKRCIENFDKSTGKVFARLILSELAYREFKDIDASVELHDEKLLCFNYVFDTIDAMKDGLYIWPIDFTRRWKSKIDERV